MSSNEQHASPSSAEQEERKPLRIVFFFEVDTGGSWRPRTNHVGGCAKRWILGPVSFGYFRNRNIGLVLGAATRMAGV